MQKDQLGRAMHFHSFSLSGILSTEAWAGLLREATAAIGMAPVYEPAIWNYPVDDKGGNGATLVQPITESFLAIDAWPDHRGAYLIICSCRQFNPRNLRKLLRSRGLSVAGEVGHVLKIPACVPQVLTPKVA